MARPRKPPQPQRQRRRRGSGSVYYSKRLDCWVAAPPASVDPKRHPEYGFETDVAAEAWLADQLDPTRKRYGDVSSKTPFGDWLRHWYQSIQGELARQSRPVYLDAIRVAEPLWSVPLGELTPSHFRTLIGAWQAKYAPHTTSTRRSLLSSALKAAMADELIPRNPIQALPRSRARRNRSEPAAPAAWSQSDAERFLEHVRGDPLEAFWRLALTTGARLHELRALQWSDIDWRAGTLTIRRGVTATGQHIDLTKTGPSRTLELPSPTLAALRRHLQAQQPLSAWCFPSSRKGGGPWSGETIRARFRALRRAAGLPSIKAYDTRHTAATAMLSAPDPMSPADVAHVLGHASPATTMRRYAKSLASNRSLITRKMERLFPDADEPSEASFEVENGR